MHTRSLVRPSLLARSSLIPLYALVAAILLSAAVGAQKGPRAAAGAPLKGVDVKLGRPPGGSPAARTTTDSEGNFTLPVVPAGEYVLTLESKKDAPNAQAERSSSAANDALKLCHITLKLAGGEKIEKDYDLAENKASEPAPDASRQHASKLKLENFVVRSDGVNPIAGTVVKSKSNISNN